MKAKTRKTFRKITVEYRFSASNKNGLAAVAGRKTVFDKKRTITLDKYSGVLIVREKGRFVKEEKRLLTPEQVREIVIWVHSRRGNIQDDEKTATIQIFGKLASDAPVLLLFQEPYKNALALATEFSELLDVNLHEQSAAAN
jgi:hypothetical protein